jgi:DNA-binding transcriptional regulator YhcF (GntR family)
MQPIFEIDSNRRTPKYLQIVHSVTKSIKLGKLKKGDRLLSINEASSEFFLARDTVQKAYNILEEDGILLPVKGKGYYINRTDLATPYRVLLVFNKISDQKKQVYESFMTTIGNKANVDLRIYHCDTQQFGDIITSHLNEYDYFVVMPHFYERRDEATRILQLIPGDRLILLDKDVDYIAGEYAAVYQDYVHDIIVALEEAHGLLTKYRQLNLIFPGCPRYPEEITRGFRFFCTQNNFKYEVLSKITPETTVRSGEVYIVIDESDLVTLIKKCQSERWEPGKDIGIISYNDTALKEILMAGITVISTDHSKMGEMAAQLILENKKEKIHNPFSLIVRKSL